MSRILSAALFGLGLAQDLFVPTQNNAQKSSAIRRYTVENLPGILQGRRLLASDELVVVGQQRPAICDVDIVAETCKVLTGDERETDVLEMEELHDILASDEESVEDFWEGLGLPRSPKCIDLCHAVVTWLEQHDHVVPPTSDVGCYHDYDSDETKCDLPMAPPDLGTDGEGNPHHGGDNPDFHEGEPDEADKNPAKPPGDYDDVEDGDDGADGDTGITYGGIGEICVEVAHLFRIYPMIEADLVNGPDDGEEDAESAQATSLRGRRLTYNDYSPSPSLDSHHSPSPSHDSHHSPSPSASSYGPAPPHGGGNWRTTVSKAEQLAVAYIATAVRKFKAKATKRHLTKWFGRESFTDKSARRQILKVLNSVNQMLSHVEYVYPGPECEPNTYAYVYPRSDTCRRHELSRNSCTKTDQGKFVFYMCRLTVERSPLSVQIETLTHEGSHHATAYTDDVCVDRGCKEVAYGRELCVDLAKTQRKKALINADNYCYYIQDITDVNR